MATEWFRNKTWDTEIQSNFEATLKRARGTYSKAQYLKIQGIELLDTKTQKTREIGAELLLRMIKEYPMEETEVVHGNEILGEYFLESEHYDHAEKHLRIVVDYYKRKSRSNTSGMADLKLAKTILKSGQTEKLVEAYEYILKFPKKQLPFNNQRYYYAELAALLCDKMNLRKEAKEFALEALKLSQITTPDFSRHKTIGLAKVSQDQINTLQRIAR